VSRSCLLALAWVGTTAALFGIGQLVVHSHAIMGFDRHVTSWVVNHRAPALDSTMMVVTWIGSWVAVAVTSGVVLVLTLTKRLTNAHLAAFAVAWAGEYATVNLIKLAVDRPRPPQDLWLITAHGASFPSGHAANATLVCATAALVAFRFTWRPAIRAVSVIVACVVLAAVGFSRVELGVHWTTDVMAGILVTLVWLVVIARVLPISLPTTFPAPRPKGVGRGGPPSDSTAAMH
jgi:undecaprenyl-diphosphatase